MPLMILEKKSVPLFTFSHIKTAGGYYEKAKKEFHSQVFLCDWVFTVYGDHVLHWYGCRCLE
jgi:hypothetical protein